MADESLSYAAPPNGLRMLIDRLLAAEKRIAALEGASPLRQAGVTATKTGLTADRSLTVNGDFASTGNAEITGSAHVGGTTLIDGTTTIDDALHITGATDIDGTLNVDATTTLGGDTDVTGALGVTGPMSIDGTLAVTGDTDLGGNLDLLGALVVTGNAQSSNYVAGSAGWRLTPTTIEINGVTFKADVVPDAALAHQVIGAAGVGTATPTITTTATAYASASVTAPSWATSASAIAISTMSLGSSALYANIQTRIAGSDGQRQDVPITSASIGGGTSVHTRAWSVTGGSTITAQTLADVATGTAPAAISTALLVTFYR